MNVFVVIPIALIPIFWLYAEFKLGRAARVSFGFLSIVVAVFLTCLFSQFTSEYERAWNRSSIKLAEELLAKGETNHVQRAFNAYNTIIATGSTFRASEKMWHVLKSEQAR